jgi:hypothetical protein
MLDARGWFPAVRNSDDRPEQANAGRGYDCYERTNGS